jgi:hypothetical protein
MTDGMVMGAGTGNLEAGGQNCASPGARMLTLHEIAEMLDEAGIDYRLLEDEDSLYVTSFAFNLWIRVHDKSGGIAIYTNWKVACDNDEFRFLRHVNQLNFGFPLVQFSWDEDDRLLIGHTWLSGRGSLPRAVLIRTAIRFADIFKEALDMTGTAGFIDDESNMATIN